MIGILGHAHQVDTHIPLRYFKCFLSSTGWEFLPRSRALRGGRTQQSTYIYYLVLFKGCLIFLFWALPCCFLQSCQLYTQYTSPQHNPPGPSNSFQLVSRKYNCIYRLAHQNQLGKFFKCRFPGLTHRDSDLLYKKQGPSIRRTSDNSKTQPDLGTSGMEYSSLNQPASHELLLIWLKGCLMKGKHRK